MSTCLLPVSRWKQVFACWKSSPPWQLASFLAVLLLATHFPGLDVNQIHGSTVADKVYHLGGYGVVTWLSLLCLAYWERRRAFVGRGWWLRRAAVMSGLFGLTVLDESTQPWFGRMFSLGDIGVDVMGIAGATVIYAFWKARKTRVEARSGMRPPAPHLVPAKSKAR